MFSPEAPRVGLTKRRTRTREQPPYEYLSLPPAPACLSTDDDAVGPRACMRLPPGDTVVADRDSDALRGEHMPERTEE